MRVGDDFEAKNGVCVVRWILAGRDEVLNEDEAIAKDEGATTNAAGLKQELNALVERRVPVTIILPLVV